MTEKIEPDVFQMLKHLKYVEEYQLVDTQPYTFFEGSLIEAMFACYGVNKIIERYADYAPHLKGLKAVIEHFNNAPGGTYEVSITRVLSDTSD